MNGGPAFERAIIDEDEAVELLDRPRIARPPVLRSEQPPLPLERPTTERSTMLDASRAIATAAIVWCHANGAFSSEPTSWIIGTFGVPFYLFVALMFAMSGFVRHPQRRALPYIAQRFRRLYLPFIFWTIVYDVLRHLKSDVGAFWNLVQFKPYFIWAGSHTHLYFVPFLLFWTAVIALIARPVIRRPQVRLPIACAALVLGLMFCWLPQPAWLDPKNPATEGLYNFFRAMPATLWAVGLAVWMGVRCDALRTASIVAIGGAVLTMSAIGVQLAWGPTIFLRSLSGLGWLLLACAPWHWPALKPIAWIGRFSFGMYLSHVVFIRLAMLISQQLHIDHTSLAFQFGAAIIAFAGSLLFTWACSRSRWTCWVVGVER